MQILLHVHVPLRPTMYSVCTVCTVHVHVCMSVCMYMYVCVYVHVYTYNYVYTDVVCSLAIPGTYGVKITHLGRSLTSFTRLKHLDLSKNAIESLQVRNIFYIKLSSARERLCCTLLMRAKSPKQLSRVCIFFRHCLLDFFSCNVQCSN